MCATAVSQSIMYRCPIYGSLPTRPRRNRHLRQTVRLGRVLVGSSGEKRMSVLWDQATAIVVVKDDTGELLPRAASVLSAVRAYREEVPDEGLMTISSRRP